MGGFEPERLSRWYRAAVAERVAGSGPGVPDADCGPERVVIELNLGSADGVAAARERVIGLLG